MATYWYDESQLEKMPQPKRPEAVDAALRAVYPNDLPLDQWGRGVLEMTEDQASQLDAVINEWNGPAHPKSLEEYNEFWIAFSPATGQEHETTITFGGSGRATTWQH